MPIGENIYLWRNFKCLTQEELAKKAGLPRPNLSAIESGAITPSLDTIRAISYALGIAPEVLIANRAPVCFEKSIFTRRFLEGIIKAYSGKADRDITPIQKKIADILLNVTRNRMNARKRRYKKLTSTRTAYIYNWLLLRSSVDKHILNGLLERIHSTVSPLR